MGFGIKPTRDFLTAFENHNIERLVRLWFATIFLSLFIWFFGRLMQFLIYSYSILLPGYVGGLFGSFVSAQG